MTLICNQPIADNSGHQEASESGLVYLSAFILVYIIMILIAGKVRTIYKNQTRPPIFH
jgi:hypothetical protein